MDLDFNLIQEDPILDSFCDDNPSIHAMIKDSYFTVLRHQGFAYTIEYENQIVGYYMIKVGATDMSGLEINDDSDNEYGALILKYIMVDERFRKKGIGSTTVEAIISYAHMASQQLPIRFLVLDALPNRQKWYRKLGFQSLDGQPGQTNIFMFMDFIDQSKLDGYVSTFY